MKARFGIERAVPRIERRDLESLPTRELLTRLERLRQCEQSLELSDMTPEEAGQARGILFKDSDAWRQATAEVKQVLSTREHLPGAAERKQRRLERAGLNRTRERKGGGPGRPGRRSG